MIKTIRIKNYLSLKDVTLKLGLRNILIGPNMAGKSNVIDSLRFLTSLAIFGAKKAFMDRGGFGEVVWKGANDDRITFEVTAEVPTQNPEIKETYDYAIIIQGSHTGLINVESEQLTITSRGTTSPIISLQNGSGKISYRNGATVIPTPIDPTTSALELNIPGWEGTMVKAWVSMWRFYNLLPPVMKQANAPLAQSFLNENGSNFASWMNTLKNTYPNNFSLIKQVALDVFPELEDILTTPTQFATTIVMAKERHLKRPVQLSGMSDGELTFLALLSLIYAPPELGAPVSCIEEPENHLHPKLIETLYQVLMQHQISLGDTAGQVILTTHSPLLVDKASIDELIVIEKKNGETMCSYPSTKRHLKELLEREELGLGNLWYSGALGGR